MLLFDLTACQPIGGTVNHGGKEYAEAIFFEIIKRGLPVSGIYNSKVEIDERISTYCKEKGDLLDINNISIQDAVNSGNYSSFYSSIPYYYDNIQWGDVCFLGNIHGLRSIEAFTDDNEVVYATTLKKKAIALIKRLRFVKDYKINVDKKRISKILDNPNFICITGSEHSKHSIMMNFPHYKEDKIHVFYDPLIIEKPDQDATNTIGKYYLLVSGNRWVKNTLRGVNALDELISAGQIDCKVVVTGYSDKLKYANKVKNKDHFIFKGYVSSSELASLYNNAYSLLFLSLSEGFGYPPLEAISRGVPVVCSPFTAIEEVYQGGVLYCNPLSVDDIKTKVLEMENKEIHNKYIQRGITRSKEIIELQNEDLTKLVDFIVAK